MSVCGKQTDCFTDYHRGMTPILTLGVVDSTCAPPTVIEVVTADVKHQVSAKAGKERTKYNGILLNIT